jgi:hypothetical protein
MKQIYSLRKTLALVGQRCVNQTVYISDRHCLNTCKDLKSEAQFLYFRAGKL